MLFICIFYVDTLSLRQVIHWKTTLHIPEESRLSSASREIILHLCNGAENRLGRNGADEIKNHQFFKSIEFSNLRHQMYVKLSISLLV